MFIDFTMSKCSVVHEKVANMPLLFADLMLFPDGVIPWAIVGLILGFLAGQSMKGGGFGLIGDMIIGLIGSLVGGYLIGSFTRGSNEGYYGSILVSFVSSCVFIAISRALKGHRTV